MKRHRDARYYNFLKAECLLSLRKKATLSFIWVAIFYHICYIWHCLKLILQIILFSLRGGTETLVSKIQKLTGLKWLSSVWLKWMFKVEMLRCANISLTFKKWGYLTKISKCVQQNDQIRGTESVSGTKKDKENEQQERSRPSTVDEAFK